MASQRESISYEFLVGKPLKLSNETFIPYKNETIASINLEDYYNSDDPHAYLFTSHQVVFSAFKSRIKKEANAMEITLFNLDDDAVNYLRTNSGNDLVCVLRAGDNVSGLLDIFKGTVKKVVDSFNDQDRRTKLSVSDGSFNMKNAFTSRSYPKNTPKERIMRDFLNDLKVPIKKLEGLEGKTERPTSFIGKTIDLMHKQAPTFFNVNFSIQDGAASVLPKDKRVKRQVSFISKDTGLIGRVSVHTDDKKSQINSVSQDSKGIQFSCLLDGNISPDETVYVQDGDFDAPYLVTEVKYDGDFEGNSWYCSVTAIETDGEIVV